ncbi:MAG TPA: hypothetical protein VEO54_01220 [Thermoanaerobaculia bacterium]|nr:hypothetical protein [Thermoanaerobaculia bacterium]
MPYKVQFVGLVCFYREQGGRQALLPDGRNPGDGIEPHVASIRVASGDVIEAVGWNGSADTARGAYELPPCWVTLEGVDADGTLDTSQHDNRLPQLKQIDANFEIDPERAETIARLRIRQGELAAYRIPGGTAAISELDVPHDGEIRVTVTPRDGSAERTLRLRPGTEVMVANMAQSGYHGAATCNNHFKIYEKLSMRPVSLQEPSSVPAVPPSLSQHVAFLRPEPIGLSVDCTNTGCC